MTQGGGSSDEREDFARLEELFTRALALSPEERGPWLREACAGDAHLLERLEALLARDASGVARLELRLPDDELLDHLDSGVVTRPEAEDGGITVPERIGGYEILGVLGRGGIGTVFEAQQDMPRRRVAIKVLQPGQASAEMLRRFRREIEVLGRLDHSGIAQVHEAGWTRPEGAGAERQPFFVMELVEGLHLDEHARAHGLSSRERMALLARVCNAVEHAHAAGIVHRDLKPANIIVDRDTGQPKVLDFGVARALEAEGLASSLHTSTGAVVGTLQYMSPEQAAGTSDLVSRHSDVYALGVIAFELLAEQRPHDLSGRPLADALQVIREERAVPLGSLVPELRGDAETIVGKALEKDPERRYASAGELATDIRRYLSHRPILARPPSAAEQLRQLARRHRSLATGAAIAIGALAIGAVVATVLAVQANRARGESDQRAYLASIAAAGAALEKHQVAVARRHLEGTLPELRNWEWDYLSARMDDSLETLAGDGVERRLLAVDGGAERVTFAEWRGPPERPSVRVLEWSPAGGALRLVVDLGEEGPHRIPREALLPALLGMAIPLDRQIVELVDEESGVTLARVPLCPYDGRRAQQVRSVDLASDPPMAIVQAPGQATACTCDLASGEIVAVHAKPEVRNSQVWVSGTAIVVIEKGVLKQARDTASNREYEFLASPARRRTSLTVAAQAHLIADIARDGTVVVRSLEDGSIVGESSACPGDERTLALSPDAEQVAIACTDGSIRIRSPDLRRELAVLHGHDGPAEELAFSSDGSYLVSSGRRSGELKLWAAADSDDGVVLRGHETYVYPVEFSADGSRILSGGWDRTVRAWDAGTGTEIAVLRPRVLVPVKQRRGQPVRWLSVSPDGDWMAGGGGRLGVHAWNMRTGEYAFAHGVGQFSHGAFHPSLGLLHCTRDSDLQRFDPATQVIADLMPLKRAGALSVSADGRWLARTVRGGGLGTWDLLSLKQVLDIAPLAEARGGNAQASAAAWSPDASLIAVPGAFTRVLDAATGELVARLPGHGEDVFAVAFSPDGTRLATAGSDGAISLWDVASWLLLLQMAGHESYVWSLDFSPDGSQLVSGSGDGTVRLWSTKSRREISITRARRERLVERAEPLVEDLLAELGDVEALVARLEDETTLEPALREVALQLAFRHGTTESAGTAP